MRGKFEFANSQLTVYVKNKTLALCVYLSITFTCHVNMITLRIILKFGKINRRKIILGKITIILKNTRYLLKFNIIFSTKIYV